MSDQFYVDSSEENGTLFTNDQQNEVSVTFTASGTWNTGSGSKIDYGPEGRIGARNKDAPYPNNTLYALLAVNSNHDVVGEGASMSLTLEANESVRLVVNDTHYANNSGQLTVDWQAQAAATRQLNAKEGEAIMELSIHPSVGVARLGNSEEFFLAPKAIGGLPLDPDQDDPTGPNPEYIESFKDGTGLIKRQGQLFRVFDDETGEELLHGQNGVEITWRVHLANKKAAWRNYSELDGDLLFGMENSYENNNVEWRNTEVGDRQTLIVDFGPRTISGESSPAEIFNMDSAGNYPHASAPPELNPETGSGTRVTTLGELRTDSQGRLIVLGGKGDSGGNQPLDSYKGADSWYDDISDGPVYCTVKRTGMDDEHLKAWVIVGCPDFAPELVNISTLSDVMFDVGVHHLGLDSGQPNYQRDILPIFERMAGYQWVANVQAMTALTLALNTFDPSDPNKDQDKREKFFEYFRRPNGKPQDQDPAKRPQAALFKSQQPTTQGDPVIEPSHYDFPMVPLNSGSNSVSNNNIVKFLTLTETQYDLLEQWSQGNFVSGEPGDSWPDYEDHMASVGNCVGLPTCPGLEVSWNMQNPAIYEAPYVIRHRYEDSAQYIANGLTPDRDECKTIENWEALKTDDPNQELGCEPGDLTKRLGIPWQADYFLCTVQPVNFTDPNINKEVPPGAEQPLPKPPAYYTHWWPVQAPWEVLSGETTKEGQARSHTLAGEQLNFARGINSFPDMIQYWYTLGYIRDQNPTEPSYPYLVETERNHIFFSFKELPVSFASENVVDWDSTIPVWFINPDRAAFIEKIKENQSHLKLADYLEQKAFKPIQIAAGGLGMPRSGIRRRR